MAQKWHKVCHLVFTVIQSSDDLGTNHLLNQALHAAETALVQKSLTQSRIAKPKSNAASCIACVNPLSFTHVLNFLLRLQQGGAQHNSR